MSRIYRVDDLFLLKYNDLNIYHQFLSNINKSPTLKCYILDFQMKCNNSRCSILFNSEKYEIYLKIF